MLYNSNAGLTNAIPASRQAKDKPSDLKLSEVYQKLGEVSIEAENYSQAVDDLNNCLNIQVSRVTVGV